MEGFGHGLVSMQDPEPPASPNYECPEKPFFEWGPVKNFNEL